MNINEFRDGIFALRTRRFGNVAEIMIKKIYQLEDSHTLEYDKFDLLQNKRIEVKFSTVMKENDEKISEANVIEQCFKANIANRAMQYEDRTKYKFDCNIQQIKCVEFDILYYGLFFADKILLFKITSDEVKNCYGYSNKQHRNNEGEGQFHINNDTFQYHQRYLIKELDYSELYNILK
jgi:hypothetical protein